MGNVDELRNAVRLVESTLDHYENEKNMFERNPGNLLGQQAGENLTRLRNNLAFVEKAEEKGIEFGNEYYLTDDIYFQIYVCEFRIGCYFYIDNDGWLYNNYIGSHSGINEWITEQICEAYDLYTGNSKYNYAFGTTSLESMMRLIENSDAATDARIRATMEIVHLVSDVDHPVHDFIVRMIDSRLEVMKTELEK